MSNNTQHDWLKIKTDFFTNRTMTLRAISDKWGIDYSYLGNVASREKWIAEKDEIWKKSESKVMEKLPETIAQVKLRHARIAQVMINRMLERIKNDTIKSSSTYFDLKTAIDIERDALGLNERKPLDEEIKRLQQFNFIFTLKPNELRRFVESAISRASIASSSDGNHATEQTDKGGGDVLMDAAEISG